MKHMKLVPESIDLSDYTGPAIPWSAEAEQSVLGGLLLRNDVFDEVRSCLDGSHFYNSAHRVIFEAIEALIVAGKVADVVTVHAELKRAGREDATGGLGYLNDLAQSVPSASNVSTYAGFVIDRALRRTLLDKSGQAQQIAQSAETADKALDEIAMMFSTIERAQRKKEPRRLSAAFPDRCDHWTDLAAGESAAGISIGLRTVDRSMCGGAHRGQLLVIGARTSVGKTALALAMAISVAEQGHGVLMLSQEMSEGELLDRIAANLAGVSLGSITEGKMPQQDWARITEAIDRAKSFPLYIDDQPALTLTDIRSKARLIKKQGGLALIVVDYLQLCAPSGSRESSRHHQIEGISRGLKVLAKELDVCVLLLSQINRSSTQRDEPLLSDLKESGSIEEDADVVILLQPKGLLPDGQQLVAAILAKNRHGKRTRVALAFHGATQRWTETTADVSARRAAE
jgi:replicative DNA helicase